MRYLLAAALLVTGGLGGASGADRYVSGQAIVKFVPALRGRLGEAGTSIQGLDLPGTALIRYERIMRRLDENALARGLDLQYLLAFDPAADVPTLVGELSNSPLVEYACPNALLRLDSLPDDSLFPNQWHLEHIGAPHAWAQAHGDSSVRLAVVADGVHWTHPDLEANLWVNAAEDINHNGRFDTLPATQGGDIDGTDQDGNGRTDDVIGFDFLDYDPNPMASDRQSSGTHGCGVQNAVTDNDSGVSAPPWNVRSIVTRCGSDGSINLSAAISAIYYLAGQDAWSIGMPFGTGTHYQPLADVCRYAWESGVIPCASAGTDGGELMRYPAGYDGVIAVAAHGRDNRKSPFSNYGTWIDVTAPGEDILSTQGPTGYERWDGTGPACNVVVGILGWMKSAYPDITRDSAVSLLRGMCDTMPDPLYWQGKLGAGRVRMSTFVTGIEERSAPGAFRAKPSTIVRSILWIGDRGRRTEDRAELLDVAGRSTLDLKVGPNDVSVLAPGVYFVRTDTGVEAGKVVVTR